ncbi:phage holin family protein [Paenibacillus ehimensis]|uniref:phage holin family protein n=1 Tax=Paenibacillus ehimensis TaxID=79264 RepID=UPI003D272DE4
MDTFFKSAIAIGGSAASFLFGGWSGLLSILLAFVVFDYVTGVAAGGKEGKLSSEIGLWGIVKKVCLFAVVAIAHLIDTALGDAHLFRDATVFYVMANELLSVLENFGRLGVSFPPILQQAIEVLRGKGKGGENR